MSTPSMAVSHGVMKRNNLSLVLGIVAQLGTASRSDIIARSHLTQPAITRIVAELINAGLLEESMPVSVRPGRGRPATVLTLKRGRFASVGVDARLDRMVVTARCLSGDVLVEELHPIGLNPEPRQLAQFIAERIDSVIARVSSQICGVGIALPAEYNETRTVVLNSFKWHWENVPIAELMHEYMGDRNYPVLFDHIAGAAALANSRGLSEHDGSLLAHLQVGLAIGIGMTRHGERVNRVGPAAMRVNHLPLLSGVEPIVPCSCGATACIESMAGYRAFVKLAESLNFEAGDGASAMQEFCQRVAEVAASDSADAPIAQAAIDTVAHWLGYLCVMIASTTGATAITVGGYPEYLGVAFQDAFMENVEKLMPAAATVLRRIDYSGTDSGLGDRASIIGAALMGLEQLRANPIFLN